jgi:hypothetical protein
MTKKDQPHISDEETDLGITRKGHRASPLLSVVVVAVAAVDDRTVSTAMVVWRPQDADYVGRR